MNEYKLPILFKNVDGEHKGLVMNLYLPSPHYYNSLNDDDKYNMYALFLIANIHNLIKWLQYRPCETHIAKITNVINNHNDVCINYKSISCEEMVSIVRGTVIRNKTSTNIGSTSLDNNKINSETTFIIIFSADGYLNTASLDIYPLKFNIHITLDIMARLSGVDFLSKPIYIKHLLIKNPIIEEYINKYAKKILIVLNNIYSINLIDIIHNYYDWDFCIRQCKFIWS
jgi:hypothetical protein